VNRRLAAFLVVIVTATGLSVAAHAQCANSFAGQTSGVTTLKFAQLGSLPSGVPANSLQDALSVWTSDCSGSGASYPNLVAGSYSTASGVMSFYVAFHPGASAARCGVADIAVSQTTGAITGGMIHIYEFQTGGGDCKANFVNIVAHEIGHALGLSDVDDTPSCNGTIMGNNPSYVSSSQCAVVADNWQTPAEDAQEACDLNCPYPCSGTPLACNTTIDTGGGHQCPYWNCSPLVLDLNGDGIHTTPVTEPVSFDITGDGVAERMGWTDPRTEEAFLWLDLTPSGCVDNGSELFGIGTKLADGTRASHGFEALAQYDDARLGGNEDGAVSAADRVWNRLRLWIDTNHDGVCDATESGPIARYGVVEIGLNYTIHEDIDESGNVHRLRSFYTRFVRGHGKPRIDSFQINDVFFRSLPPD